MWFAVNEKIDFYQKNDEYFRFKFDFVTYVDQNVQNQSDEHSLSFHFATCCHFTFYALNVVGGDDVAVYLLSFLWCPTEESSPEFVIVCCCSRCSSISPTQQKSTIFLLKFLLMQLDRAKLWNVLMNSVCLLLFVRIMVELQTLDGQ